MDDVEQRLIRCFQLIFPGLSDHDVRHGQATTVSGWDSLATVTLINVVEEEFGIQIDVEDMSDFLSFQQFLRHLTSRLPEEAG